MNGNNRPGLGSENVWQRMARLLVLPPRTWLATATGFLAGILAQSSSLSTRILVGWDAFALTYLAAVAVTIARSNIDDIRRRAAVYDENRWVILTLILAAAGASMVALVVELANAASQPGRLPPLHIALAALTVALSWSVTHVVFALHYAHVYYGEGNGGDRGGLELPGQEAPTLGDFIYFAFVIGCATATADVSISNREMRRAATLHGIVAFAFNTAILALSINLGAGLVQGGGS